MPDIALECAGILASLGQPTSLMVRSVCLRAFDQVRNGLSAAYHIIAQNH